MFRSARARLSVPPPGPAVRTHSIAFGACQAACTGAAPASRIAAVDSRSLDVMLMFPPSRYFFKKKYSDCRSGDLLASLAAGGSGNDRSLLFERLDLLFVETVFAQ